MGASQCNMCCRVHHLGALPPLPLLLRLRPVLVSNAGICLMSKCRCWLIVKYIVL